MKAEKTVSNLFPQSEPNRPLFALREDAAPADVAAYQYDLCKRAEAVIWSIEDMTENKREAAANINQIAYMIEVLSDINRQQKECAEFMDDPRFYEVRAAA